MKAVWSGGTPPRMTRHAIFQYYHPLDECRNGGMRWTVVHDEIAPGLFDIRHPKCSMCLAEPQIDTHQVVDGEYDPAFRTGPIISADGQTVTQERIERTPVERAFTPWPEVKERLATARGKREPHRETEPLFEEDREES